MFVYGTTVDGFMYCFSHDVFRLTTRNAQQAAELSGMAHSVGYLLAAIGPTLFGFIHDATNSWTIPLLILVGASVLLFIFGLGVVKDQYIGSINSQNI